MKPRLTLALVLLSLSAASAAQTTTLPEFPQGEIATTEGQPSGRRSVLGRTTLGRWMS